ncbi:MAG: hypothetical protein V2B19_20965 [Pseudomonadota bacterium]
MRYPDFIEKPFPFPSFFRVQMPEAGPHITDVADAITREMRAILPESGIKGGNRVALCVGSRGIHQLPVMIRAMCDEIKAVGAHPVILPAMGSHGGATAAGQREVLERLGVSEASCGAPILSSMDTVQLGTVLGEVPVHYSADAFNMDHAITLNRIKPHTKFKAPIESGLLKMLCVGMGKHQGALAWHHFVLKFGFFELLSAMGEAVIERSNYRFGIGVVENAHDRLIAIEAVPASRTRERETALLELAKAHFPRLPVREADVLIIDHIGKEVSGAGMDPNVTGRGYDLRESDFSGNFRATRVAVLNLTENTAGNAIGLGNADFITDKVFENLDYEKTVMNALTSNSIRKAFIPVRLPSDEKAIQACFTTIGPIAPDAVRAVIIRNTRHLSGFWASGAMRPELEKLPNVRLFENTPLRFDAMGILCWETVQ